MKGYYNCARLLAGTAKKYGGFDVVKIYTPSDLDDLFRERNTQILSNAKGGGFWLYKPYIILYHMLHLAKANDLICYLDATYVIKRSLIPSLIRLTSDEPYIGVYKGLYRPNVYFTTLPERQYSKADAFLIMGLMNETYQDSEQAWSGLITMKNSFYSIQFLAEWLTYAQDYRIISDDPSVLAEEDESFIANRHDQTICSLLLKKWGIYLNVQLPSENGSFLAQEEKFIIEMPDGEFWSLLRWEPDGADLMMNYCRMHYDNIFHCEQIAEYVKTLEERIYGSDMLPENFDDKIQVDSYIVA
jgi:hypothetical protein